MLAIPDFFMAFCHSQIDVDELKAAVNTQNNMVVERARALEALCTIIKTTPASARVPLIQVRITTIFVAKRSLCGPIISMPMHLHEWGKAATEI